MESTAFTIELTEAEWDQVGDAIPDTADLIRDAAGTLDMMADLLAGDISDLHPPHCAAALRLAARGLRAAEVGEIAALDLVERELRRSRAAEIEARRRAEDLAKFTPSLRAAMRKVLEEEEEARHADQP